ncbi:hypothetical protein C8R45DRAFT_961028 [Mycena sanguinolenta]|nr:hypothetical protein C8R45DRAFT_961028 [Mycena sanguinolenta]
MTVWFFPSRSPLWRRRWSLRGLRHRLPSSTFATGWRVELSTSKPSRMGFYGLSKAFAITKREVKPIKSVLSICDTDKKKSKISCLKRRKSQSLETPPTVALLKLSFYGTLLVPPTSSKPRHALYSILLRDMDSQSPTGFLVWWIPRGRTTRVRRASWDAVYPWRVW